MWVSKGAGAPRSGAGFSVNIFGGFLVTQRMLAMYRKKERPKMSLPANRALEVLSLLRTKRSEAQARGAWT